MYPFQSFHIKSDPGVAERGDSQFLLIHRNKCDFLPVDALLGGEVFRALLDVFKTQGGKLEFPSALARWNLGCGKSEPLEGGC